MSTILGLLNLGFIAFIVLTFSKENISQTLGGTLVLFPVLPFLLLLPRLFKRHRIELQLLPIMIVLTFFAWQYLYYYEINSKFSFAILISFLAIQIIICVLQAYFIAKPIYPQKKSIDKDVYRAKLTIFQTVLMKLYFYEFSGLAFSFSFGIVILASKTTYLVRSNMILFVPIGIFWALMANISAFLSLRRMNDKYFAYIYQKKDINYSKIKKYILYTLGILFVLGAVLETITRHEITFYIETYLFAFSSLLLIGRIYKMENSDHEQVARAKDEGIPIDDIKIDYRSHLKYYFALTIIGSISLIIFILFLKSVSK